MGLARRLEGTEGRANASFVEARAEIDPSLGATWIQASGAYVLFDGPDSPLTQTFGLGLLGGVTDADLDVVEGFFEDRGASVQHEVSPLAEPALLPLLVRRGYRPIEFSSVLFRTTVGPVPPGPTGVRVRRIEPGEETLWADVAAEGWRSEAPELVDFLRGIGEVSARAVGTHAFLAEREGEPIAAGTLHLGRDVALLAGASTRPEFRGLGAQSALLAARLNFAAGQNVGLAAMAAPPGSISQRNAERRGFRIAYTRIKWKLGA